MKPEIIRVTSRRELKAFIELPLSLYKGHPCYVPALFFDEANTLRRDRNAAFDHCEAEYWLARHEGRVVGRIAGIINHRYIEKWQKRQARFGWIDFIDDEEVAAALLGTVEAWAREKGMTALHGPLGFTDLDREGMLVEGFDELGTLATIYNHPWYPCHLEKLGYRKDTDWLEFEMQVPREPDEKIARIADIALRRNQLRLLEVRHKKELLYYGEAIFRLIDEEYSALYGVVPLTPKQVQGYISQYFGFVSPDFVPLVVDEQDRLVAFGVTLPSLSRALQKARGRLLPFGFIHLLRALKKNERADLYLVAVQSAYQGKGVNAVLIDRMNRVFNRLGVTRVESNPELETNLAVQDQWKYFERRQHKRRRCYIRELG